MKKRIISIGLAMVLTISTIVGCSKNNTNEEAKEDFVAEEAFTTLPEHKLLTKNFKNFLVNNDEVRNEFNTYRSFFFGDGSEVDQAVIDKYKFIKPAVKNDLLLIKEQSPELFDKMSLPLSLEVYSSQNKSVMSYVAPIAKNYLSDVYLDKNIGEYGLTEEFKMLESKSKAQKYLEKNNITDLEFITFPEPYKNVRMYFDTEYLIGTYPVEVSGIQNGEPFVKKLFIDFIFRTSKLMRDEMDVKLDSSDWEIEQVKLYSDSDYDKVKFVQPIDIEKAKEAYGLEM